MDIIPTIKIEIWKLINKKKHKKKKITDKN